MGLHSRKWIDTHTIGVGNLWAKFAQQVGAAPRICAVLLAAALIATGGRVHFASEFADLLPSSWTGGALAAAKLWPETLAKSCWINESGKDF